MIKTGLFAWKYRISIRRKSARIEWKSARRDLVGKTRVLELLRKQLIFNTLPFYTFERHLPAPLSYNPLHLVETFVTPWRSIHLTLTKHSSHRHVTLITVWFAVNQSVKSYAWRCNLVRSEGSKFFTLHSSFFTLHSSLFTYSVLFRKIHLS